MLSSVRALALTALLAAGCGSPEPAPEPAVDRFELTSRDVDASVEDLVKEMTQKHAMGWPERVTQTGDPARPSVLLELTNRTRSRLDLEAVQHQVVDALTRANLASVAVEGAPPAEGRLSLRGAFNDERTSAGVKYKITFTLTDPRDGTVLLSTRTVLGKMGP